MFELRVETEFCAAHSLVIHGKREPIHGHNWRVTLVVAGDRLDDDGLLCDFHLLERRLREVVAPFHNADLNGTAPFDRINPTAERVAEQIGIAMLERVNHLPASARLVSLAVTEAPGCAAVWRPDPLLDPSRHSP